MISKALERYGNQTIQWEGLKSPEGKNKDKNALWGGTTGRMQTLTSLFTYSSRSKKRGSCKGIRMGASTRTERDYRSSLNRHLEIGGCGQSQTAPYLSRCAGSNQATRKKKGADSNIARHQKNRMNGTGGGSPGAGRAAAIGGLKRKKLMKTGIGPSEKKKTSSKEDRKRKVTTEAKRKLNCPPAARSRKKSPGGTARTAKRTLLLGECA